MPSRSLISLALSLSLLLTVATHAAADVNLFRLVERECPSLSHAAINTGIKAYQTAYQAGLDAQQLLTIVDFTKPSNQNRLCAINIKRGRVLFNTLVSHGRGSGLRYAEHFSNQVNTHESSIGVYLTGKSYHGEFGYAMRLYGLDRGFNSNAAKRDIVVHPDRFVSKEIALRFDRVGRTWGCFALEPKLTKPFINTVRNGSLIVAYYPNKHWLQHSIFLQSHIENAQQQILALIKQQQ